MSAFWQFMSNVGFYIAVIFLVLTIVFAQSSRRMFQKLQFSSLIIAVLIGVISVFALSRTSEEGGTSSTNSSRTPSSATGRTRSGTTGGPPAAGNRSQDTGDIQPSFVDAALLHFLVVPVFGKDRPVAVLQMNFSRTTLTRKKISECFLVSQAEPSVSSDRVLLTPKKLICRKGDGSLASIPIKAYVLDAEDGKLGLKARREELLAVPPVSPAMAEVAKEAGLVLEQTLTKGSGLESSFQVVRTGRLASVIVMEAITLPE